jgi:hypothetical protein
MFPLGYKIFPYGEAIPYLNSPMNTNPLECTSCATPSILSFLNDPMYIYTSEHENSYKAILEAHLSLNSLIRLPFPIEDRTVIPS